MKFFAMAFLALGLSSAAQAATVDLKFLSAPASGSGTQELYDSSNYISGQLAANSILTINYAYSAVDYATLSSSHWYTNSPQTGNWYNTGSAFAYYLKGASDRQDLSANLIVSTANVSSNAGSLVVKNLSSSTLNFSSYLWVMIKDVGAKIGYSYTVASVPLPAALPLFGSGLVGLAFVRRRKQA